MSSTATKVRYSYLPQQFAEPDAIFDAIRAIVAKGDLPVDQHVTHAEQDYVNSTVAEFYRRGGGHA